LDSMQVEACKIARGSRFKIGRVILKQLLIKDIVLRNKPTTTSINCIAFVDAEGLYTHMI